MKWFQTEDVYYNEIDPLKAEVLREAVKAGAIAKGDVDERSIVDVQPDELVGYTQCHFFAGGGFWSLALRLAGWPDNRPVWTGSCPCQSFSNAGSRRGFADERHLWPEWFRLIHACKPPVIFGEQVFSAARAASGDDEDMRTLWDRETILRVFRRLEKEAPEYMQGVRARDGETAQTLESRVREARSVELVDEAAWSRSGEYCEAEGKTERDGLHPGFRGHSGKNRPWILRGHGDEVRSENPQSMELSLFGSDQPLSRLYAGKHEGSPLFLECDGERLGSKQGRRDRQRDPKAACKAERRIQRTIARSLGEEARESWLDLVCGDLENSGYAIGAEGIGAHSVGAPHIRQRLYFVADTDGRIASYRDLQRGRELGLLTAHNRTGLDAIGSPYPMHAKRRPLNVDGCDGRNGENSGRAEAYSEPRAHREVLGSQHSFQSRLEGHVWDVRDWRGPGWLDPITARSIAETGATRGFWGDCDWWYGRDEKYRPIGPGLQPLAHGSTARVGRLRLYGDGIVVQAAQAFIEAYLEVENDRRR